jgi:triosephosphate isomerase
MNKTLRTPLVAGNWKMNGNHASNAALVSALKTGYSDKSVELLVCPTLLHLESVAAQLSGSGIALGAQNLSDQSKAGAFTGEVLGSMLVESGCAYVLVGHSERRSLYVESNAVVAAKFVAAQAFGLVPVLCVGESLEQRDQDQTEAVLAAQLDAVLAKAGIEAFAKAVVAYEPVWAIGTGRTASAAQAQAAHAFIRNRLKSHDATIADRLRILYGGSVKPDNAAVLFAGEDVDGGLIGGAALQAADFLAIYQAALA